MKLSGLSSLHAAVAAVLALGAVPGLAQDDEPREQAQDRQQAQDGERLEEIVVEAPWMVEREVVGRSAVGAPVEEISLSRRVSYADLDLTQHADVMELESRIDNIAREACDMLAEMFPLADHDTRECVDDAMDGAMAQADDAVEAAVRQQEQDVAAAPEE